MSLPSPLDANLLRAFVEVVDSGGFSQAATRLRRGQSAISLQIKRLEERLGVRLFDRGPRHVRLTPEGERILDLSRRILSLNDELLSRTQEPEMAGLVRLGAPEDFATSHLPQVLASFARTYPQVALEVTCELTLELLEHFEAGELDLALVKRVPSGGPQGIRVWREPLVWAGAHTGLVDGPGPVPLVVSPRPCVYRKRATDALDRAEQPWRIAYTCGSLAGNHAAIRAGLGVTVLPQDMVPEDLTVLSEGLPPLADTEIALITAKKLNPPAQRLAETIIRALERVNHSLGADL
ncbi:MAG: LysR substrate-binding domain-containing protein [Rhodospirillaceae bacterium]